MKLVDKSMHAIAVEKVLKEMHEAEEYVKSWNASWWKKIDADYLPFINEINKTKIIVEMVDRSCYFEMCV